VTDSDWWSRAKLPPPPQPIEIRKRELLARLRKGGHAVTLEKAADVWHNPWISARLDGGLG
jgi:hypothetical protein